MKQPHKPARLFRPGLSFVTACMLFLFFYPAQAQNNQNQPVYVAFTYLKAKPEKYNDYLNLVRTYTKKMQQYQMDQGNQSSWYFYEVLMPSGTEAEYNFVGVNVSNKIDQLLDPALSFRELMPKVFPQMAAQQADSVQRQFQESRSLVKREIYMPLSSTNPNGPPTQTPTRYVQMNFMTPSPGKEAQYVKMETDMFLPIHKERMHLNALKGWILAQKMMPSESNAAYSYITADFYDDFSGMMDGKYEQAVKKALPNQDVNKLMQYVNTVKKGQRSEVWKLVDYAQMQ